jgi:hypothetical protein
VDTLERFRVELLVEGEVRSDGECLALSVELCSIGSERWLGRELGQ